MALNPKVVKNINVITDKEIGEAVVMVTLLGVHRDDIRTALSTSDIIPIAEERGINILDVIKHDNISNRHGEITGIWIFKIPTTDPENSTSTILKRRERKKKIEAGVEEDWNLGPEE